MTAVHPGRSASVARLVREEALPFQEIDQADIEALIEHIGEAKVVLLGEATHGTSEFYRMRARITRDLIARRGFNLVAVEADWPDARSIDRYVRHLPRHSVDWLPFARFPTWMWRNHEVADFTEWLRAHNADIGDLRARTGFFGLDLYSLFASLDAVLRYLDRVDPPTAAIARERYACLTPWQHDPAVYGHVAVTGRYRSCEAEAVAILRDLLRNRMDYAERDGLEFLDAVQNARLVADAEQYYRVMYYGAEASWNLRDRHMFETLQHLLAFHGPDARAVVWAHNSHIGDASATEMSARGELNIGQLCREHFGDQAALVGFGTDHGTVTAASEWNGPAELKQVRPALPESYEAVCHETGVEAFVLQLRDPRRAELRDELQAPRLERAIGVIYRPETERPSHYFHAALPHQFDAYIWFDETRAIAPLPAPPPEGLPDTYPFGQ